MKVVALFIDGLLMSAKNPRLPNKIVVISFQFLKLVWVLVQRQSGPRVFDFELNFTSSKSIVYQDETIGEKYICHNRQILKLL